MVTLVDPDRQRHCRLTQVGTRVEKSSWTGNAKPRTSSRDHASEKEAHEAFRREVGKRMRDGFVYLAEDAAPGQVVLELLAPHRGHSQAFDLSRDGTTLAVGITLPDARGAEIHLVDVATGKRRLVHTESAGPRQTFLHTVMFDAAGERLVYAVNETTGRLDLASGATDVLSEYREGISARFNPFCARPEFDDGRSRLLAFDADDMVRVLDGDGRCVFETSTASATTVGRTAAISASGRLLAIYRVSRGVVYGHKDAVHDTTNVVDVWDIDEHRLVCELPVPDKLTAVGFDPEELRVLALPSGARPLTALPIDPVTPGWELPDRDFVGRPVACFSARYSPSGAALALGLWGHGLVLRDPVTLEPAPITLDGEDNRRVQRIVFSADGTFVAAGGDEGRIVVRRLK